MSDLPFAKYTALMLRKLPYWFKMRKHSKDSLGARYLNIIGLDLDYARYTIGYAYQQCYIGTIDDTQIDFCYKSIIPMPFKLKDIDMVFGNGIGLYRANTLKHFFGIGMHDITDEPLNSFETYYADTERNIIYVRQAFNVDNYNPNGKIRIQFKDGTRKEFSLTEHHVWNYMDELGALVSCPRLPQEPNVEYKKRIEDVFINYSNASRDGLINGIGRELALRRNLEWKDPYRDLELEDSMVVLNSIKINGEYISQDRVFISAQETVIIKAYDEGEAPDSVLVTYVHGLEMHELSNIKEIPESCKDYFKFDVRDAISERMKFVGRRDIDTVLFNELFTVEEKPKQRLRDYIQIVNTESPIFWDYFRWNEHYWDQNEQDISGTAFIPNLYDGSINGFKEWTHDNKDKWRRIINRKEFEKYYTPEQHAVAVSAYSNYILANNGYYITLSGIFTVVSTNYVGFNLSGGGAYITASGTFMVSSP